MRLGLHAERMQDLHLRSTRTTFAGEESVRENFGEEKYSLLVLTNIKKWIHSRELTQSVMTTKEDSVLSSQVQYKNLPWVRTVRLPWVNMKRNTFPFAFLPFFAKTSSSSLKKSSLFCILGYMSLERSQISMVSLYIFHAVTDSSSLWLCSH